MEALIRPCENCQKPMNGGVYRHPHMCPHCRHEHEGGKTKRRKARKPSETAAPMELTEDSAVETSKPAVEAATTVDINSIVVTSKPAGEQNVLQVMASLAAECVLNLKLTADLFEDGKFLGTKSEKIQAALKQGRKHALAQLLQKAQKQGANLISDVAVKNAIKKKDAERISIIVKASGKAAKAELPQAACEA